MVERVIGNDEVTGPIPVPSFFCVQNQLPEMRIIKKA